MRVRLGRILLLLAGLLNFLLALSIPPPWVATTGQLANAIVFTGSAALCAIAFVRLRRRLAGGRHWAVGCGLAGALLLAWNVRGLVAMIGGGTGAQALSAGAPLAAWTAQLLAAALIHWGAASGLRPIERATE